ncbi:MAG TPA: YedE family putative selenium transporter [Coriobacteriia bacterium]|nr:YedE family putative selenium transporter [Coriobacteriia bacterium]
MARHRTIGPSALMLGGAGVIIGVAAAWLVSQGNPGNMGVCVACFNRDIAGAFGGAWANMGGVAYIRPEIIGLLFGGAVAAVATREFRPRGGSSVVLRFMLGFIFMLSSLIFLGCTVRAWLRLGGGDLNALWGIAGIAAGVVAGALFLKRGFNLGRARVLPRPVGWIGTGMMGVLLVFALMTEFGSPAGFVTTTAAGARATAEGAVIQGEAVLRPEDASLVDGEVVAADGAVISPAASVEKATPLPGGRRAPLLISLVAGLALGVVAQRSRFCTMGGFRDLVLVRRFDLLFAAVGLLVGSTVANLVLGQYNLGFTGQPVAHTDALGNFAAMAVAGLAAAMLGGCPFRQVIMSGEGDADAFVAVLGMIAGALVAHRFVIASTGAGLAENAWPALAVMMAVLLGIAFVKRERLA